MNPSKSMWLVLLVMILPAFTACQKQSQEGPDSPLILYAQRHLLENLGGDYYWTSTSISTHAASVIDFRDGSHHGAHRNIPNVSGPVAAWIYVRPVRGF